MSLALLIAMSCKRSADWLKVGALRLLREITS